MRVYEVTFSIRKGLGPDYFNKTLSVGLDDLEEDMTDYEIESLAVDKAEEYLYKSEDYQHYGKNWFLKHVERA